MSMKRMWSRGQIKNLSKEVIESGLVENAKPIYLHPISIINGGTDPNVCRLTCLVFNNDSTPFTLSSFFDWIKDLADEIGEARVMISGGYWDNANSKIVIASYIYKDVNQTTFSVTGMATNGTPASASGTLAQLFPNATLEDNVNKIN